MLPGSCVWKLPAVAAALAFLLACVAATAQPLPLGTLTLNATSDPQVPSGYTAQGFTVSCPGVTQSINGFIAIRSGQGPRRGMLVASTGGGGTGYWTAQSGGHVYTFAEELRALGFSIVQIRWAANWLESSPGNDAGQARLGCRPATVIKYIHDTYYRPLGIFPLRAGEAGFAVTGNSGGSSQTAYALSHYGLDNIIDVAIPTGGPPHAALAKSCMNNPGEQAYWFNLSTREFIDRGFGFFSGNGPAAQHDGSFIPRWLQASHSTGGNDYFHPRTRVHFIIGEYDLPMQATGGDYYQRLIAEGTPYVDWEIAPATPHAVYGTTAGRAAIKAALLQTWPVVTGFTRSGGSVRVEWSSIAGRSYQLQAKTQPTDGGWIDIGSRVVASGTSTFASADTAGVTRQFYRVRLWPIAETGSAAQRK
jgi:hypothetical protein